jgi:GMP reductase
MLGGMLSGHDEGEGEVISEDGKNPRVVFYGMSSDTAMDKHHGGVANYRSSEGRTVEVKYRGAVKNTVLDLLGGLRSTCTYVGAPTLKQLSKCTTFIRVNRQINDVFLK